MKLIRLACAAVCVWILAGCTTSQPASAPKPKLASSARAIIGTSLIGARGATAADQNKIDDTAAGLCGARVWTVSECLRHQAGQG